MAKSLLIVESPTKAKTIKRYVGNGFSVKATVGHIKDLPTSKLGVDIEKGFEPQLLVIKGKKKVLDEIKRSARTADRVLLAPDPDREGEAIAWHVAEELQGTAKDIKRVVFNEITRQAVQQALEHPRELDRQLYQAQQARRILDRLVGYQISPLLWKKVKRGLSAGRVQSVALRLIVEREREIAAFVPQEYWTVEEEVRRAGHNDGSFRAVLSEIDGQKAERIEAARAEEIRRLVESSPQRVVEVEKKKRSRRPPPPFTTSTLQQAASSQLNFSARRTMRAAQQLYEGVEIAGEGQVGLITYMRTDSTRIAEPALAEVRAFIKEKFGQEYLPPEPVRYRAKAGAQDAHEAIRPTDVRLTPEKVKDSLSRDQARLYELVWRRFVACQMQPAQYDQTAITIQAGERCRLKASGSRLVFDGFLAVGTKNGDEENGQLPELAEGDQLEVLEVKALQHFTQPPPRFTEGTLVKEMEEKGIGRPSTYATILETIQAKQYVKKVENRLQPTELGSLVTDLLVESFPEILDVGFTAAMEEKLDCVEEGRQDWKKLLQDFYVSFSATLERAGENMRNLKREEIPTEHRCEKCGKVMVKKWGRNGYFLACSGYPECRNTKQIASHNGSQVELAEQKPTGISCPKCGKPLVQRQGRFGRFLACSGYPECRHTQAVSTGIRCPQCGQGELVERRSQRGKVFYGCNRYPQCKFSLFTTPVAESCPQCEYPLLVYRKSREGTLLLACPREGCGYSRPAPEAEREGGQHAE